MLNNDAIVALATPSGAGAIAIIRISGQEAITIGNSVFKSIKNKNLLNQKTHTLHLGHIVDDTKTLDEVLVSIFKGPNSYTGENTIEISCHGSTYIQQQIIQLLLRKGCRMADAGEFTLRAFLNGKLDLSQAEAVADLISSDNEASHQIAMQQMRGGFSNEIAKLREELLNFASLNRTRIRLCRRRRRICRQNTVSRTLKPNRVCLKTLNRLFCRRKRHQKRNPSSHCR